METERIRNELRQNAEKRARERAEEARNFQLQAWQTAREDEDKEEPAAPDHVNADDEDGDEVEEEQGMYCVACGKGFKSQAAWENHERSRKHIKAVETFVFPGLLSKMRAPALTAPLVTGCGGRC